MFMYLCANKTTEMSPSLTYSSNSSFMTGMTYKKGFLMLPSATARIIHLKYPLLGVEGAAAGHRNDLSLLKKKKTYIMPCCFATVSEHHHISFSITQYNVTSQEQDNSNCCYIKL